LRTAEFSAEFAPRRARDAMQRWSALYDGAGGASGKLADVDDDAPPAVKPPAAVLPPASPRTPLAPPASPRSPTTPLSTTARPQLLPAGSSRFFGLLRAESPRPDPSALVPLPSRKRAGSGVFSFWRQKSEEPSRLAPERLRGAEFWRQSFWSESSEELVPPPAAAASPDAAAASPPLAAPQPAPAPDEENVAPAEPAPSGGGRKLAAKSKPFWETRPSRASSKRASARESSARESSAPSARDSEAAPEEAPASAAPEEAPASAAPAEEEAPAPAGAAAPTEAAAPAPASAAAADGERLYEAARAGDVDEVARLGAAGARATWRNCHGWTPLHVASVWYDDPPLVAALVAAGAEIDAADAVGATALMFAAFHGRRQVVEALVARGASADAVCGGGAWAGLTASAIARRAGRAAVAAFLDGCRVAE